MWKSKAKQKEKKIQIQSLLRCGDMISLSVLVIIVSTILPMGTARVL